MGFALSEMRLTSTAFGQSKAIPAKYTGEGEDISPPLAWAGTPDGVRSCAVVCHDPDAPLISPKGVYGFVHWVLYNIPADATSLEEATDRYTAGTNDFGRQGYGGPMPPPGHGPHHYYFWILALDRRPDLPPKLSLWELLKQIEPHVIGMNRLIGVYERFR